MNYMQEVDTWLSELLTGLPANQLEEAKKQIKARILESYKNGLKATPRKTTDKATS